MHTLIIIQAHRNHTTSITTITAIRRPLRLAIIDHRRIHTPVMHTVGVVNMATGFIVDMAGVAGNV
jgi:hypothetical protein